MKNSRIIIIILVITILALATYAAISGTSSIKKIKRLTVDLEHNADSLETLRIQYDSITHNYDDLYREFELTKNQLVHFKSNMDSIMDLRIKSVSALNKALGTVLEEQDSIAKRDSTAISFRF